MERMVRLRQSQLGGIGQRFLAATTATLMASLAIMPVALAATSPVAATPTTNGSAPSSGFNVIITPTSEELVTKPGQSVSTNIQVENEGLSIEHLKVTIYTFSAYGTDGTPRLEAPTAQDSFINWASVSSSHFDAAPNVFTSFKLTIAPPASAAFGYYYAVIVSRDNQAAANTGTNLQGAIASLILLDVQAPGEKRQASVAQFSTAHNVTEFLPVKFNVLMHNTGNVHVAPHGDVFIYKGGKLVGTIDVNEQGSEILPNSERQFNPEWTDGTPVYKIKEVDGKAVLNKQDQTESSLDWSNFNLSKLRFGNYTAKLTMVYDDGEGDISTQASLNFWVIPWRIIAVLIVVLLVILAGLWTLLLRPIYKRSTAKRTKTFHQE
jgi:hypothetical protein